MSDYTPLLNHILIFPRFIAEIDKERIYGILERDSGKYGSIRTLGSCVVFIQQVQRIVTIYMYHCDRRFGEIIINSRYSIGIVIGTCATGVKIKNFFCPGIFIYIRQRFSKIDNLQTIVPIGFQNRHQIFRFY
ncbi:hypothetical protein SDC9_211192 [bioreactor metagenome]|uniref:Uncharacterized protein n=1 Tax=bioreactor metagenome TaxID=1076179 RepID=A0A645JW55_9ZZZZ